MVNWNEIHVTINFQLNFRCFWLQSKNTWWGKMETLTTLHPLFLNLRSIWPIENFLFANSQMCGAILNLKGENN